MPAITTEQHHIRTQNGTLFAQCWTPAGQTGAPIILLHDSLGCVVLWRTFPEQLASITGRRVIAYDRLGFGQSSSRTDRLAPDFVQTEVLVDFDAVRQHFGVSSHIVLGHSVGGAMAICCAATSPQSCEGLITIAAQGYVDQQILDGIRGAESQFALEGQMQRLEKYHGHKAAWVLRSWVDTWCSETFKHWNLDAWLPKVRCAFLCLHGDHDEYGSTAHPHHLVSRTQGPANLHILSDCGHLPHREQPCAVLERIRAFLECPRAGR